MESNNFTSQRIQAFLMRWLYDGHPLMCPNFAGANYEESDVLAVSASHVVKEYEIKISRSDFKADFKKKRKHMYLSGKLKPDYVKVPNKFYYVCPENLIRVEEVPEYAGLLYVVACDDTYTKEDCRIEVIREAPYIHKEKPEQKTVERIASGAVAKMIFGKAYLTWQNEKFRLFSRKEAEEYEQLKRGRTTLSNEDYFEFMAYRLLQKRMEGGSVDPDGGVDGWTY